MSTRKSEASRDASVEELAQLVPAVQTLQAVVKLVVQAQPVGVQDDAGSG